MPTDATRGKRQDDRKQEEAVRDSFPASDPPATSGIVGPGEPKAPDGAGRAQRPPAQRDGKNVPEPKRG